MPHWMATVPGPTLTQARGTWDESGNGGHSVPPETGVQGDTGALTGSGSKAPRWGDLWVEPAETDLEAQVGVQCRGTALPGKAKAEEKLGGPSQDPRKAAVGGRRLGECGWVLSHLL